MANEFVARNGLIAQSTSRISGSLLVTDGNVGVGTATPANKLHVIQDSSTAGISVSGIVGVNPQLRATDGTRIAKLQVVSSTGIVGTESNNDFAIYSNNAEVVRITTTGNVGISSTAPTSKLQVVVPESTSGVTALTIVGNTNSKVLALGAAATYAFVQSHGSVPLYINELGNNVIINPATGNVAIGKTSPLVKLDVSGSVAVSSTDGLRIGAAGDNSSYDNVKIYYAGYNAGAPRIYLTPRTTPGSGIVQSYFHLLNSNGSSTTSNNTMGLLVDGNVVVGSVSTINAKMHVSSSTGGILRLDGVNGSAVLYASSSGFIGIGKTNPSYTLDITGSFSATTSGVAIVYNSGVLYHGNYYQFTSGNNYLLYARGGGDLLLGSNDSETIRAASSGNVGIGSTTPGAKLDVVGNVRAQSFTGSFSGSSAAPGASTNIIYNSSGVLAGSNSFVFDGTNIGIGTTAPSQKLTIYGGNATGQIKMGFSDTANWEFGRDNSVTGDLIFTNNLSGNAYERIRVKQGTGDIGIGSTAPITKLDVVGGIRTTTGLTVTGSVAVQLGSGFTGFIDANANAFVIRHSNSGTHITMNNSNSTVLSQIVTANNSLNVTPGANSTTLGLSITSGSYPAATLLSVGSNVLIVTGSSVGIGTTAPLNRLHIYNSVTGSGIERTTAVDVLTLESENTTAVEYDGFGQIINFRGVTYNDSTKRNLGRIIHKIRDASGGATPNGTSLHFELLPNSTASVPVERVVFDYTGNVGIGSTTPGAKLDVSGNVRATSFTGSFSGSITSPGSNTQVIFNSSGSLAASSGFVFTGASVGIGTTSPLHPLDVASAGNTILYIRGGTSTSLSRLVFGTSANTDRGFIDYDNTAASRNMSFKIAELEGMRIDNNGNLGIGTTIPVNKIQANYSPVAIDSLTATAGTGSTNWNRNAGVLITGASISNALAIGVSGTGNDRKTWIQAGHPDTAAQSLGSISLNPLGGNIGIGTTSPTGALDVRGIVYISGNVGIGTTSPTFKLDVSGSSRFGGNTVISGSFEVTRPAATQTAGDLLVDSSNSTIYIGKLDSGAGNTTTIFRDRLGTVKARYENAGSGLIGFGNFGTNYGVSITSYSPQTGTIPARLLVDSGANTFPAALFLSGSVGIGTTTPSASLDVSGFGRFTNGLQVTGSFVATSMTASSLLVNGTITAQTLVVSTVSSSVVYSSGSNIFGNSLTNVQQFTGSLRVTGSGNHWIMGGNIGVDINAPLYKLDVNGIIRSKSGTTGSLYLGETTGGTTYVAAALIGTPSTTYNPVGRLSIQIPTHGVGTDYGLTEQMSIQVPAADSKAATMVLLPFGGNVGIGTSVPDARLTVQGSLSAASQAMENILTLRRGFNSGVAFEAAAALALGRNSGDLQTRLNFVLDNSSSGLFEYNSTVLTLLSGGNVGIGSTTPGATLDVVGNVRAQSFTGSFSGSSAAPGSNTNIIYNNSGVLAGSNSFVFNGTNVGIGTTSPSTAKLVIFQTGGTQLNLISGEAFGSADVVLRLTSANDYRGRGIWMDHSAAAGSWYAGVPYTGGSYSIGYDTTQPEYIANSKLLITTAGNVAINSTVTNYKFQVNTGISSSQAYGISIQQGTNGANKDAAAFGIAVQNSGASTNAADLFFATATGGSLSERMRITSGGNIGIGTTAPTTQLDVRGNSFFSGSLTIQNSTGLQIYDTTGTYGPGRIFTSYAYALGEVYIQASGSIAPTVFSPNSGVSIGGQTTTSPTRGLFVSGSVGIGTATPGYKLDVSGSIRIPNSEYIYINSSAGTATQILGVDAGNNTVINTPTGGDIYIRSAGTTIARYISSGTIYLGGTSATASPKLAILTGGSVGIGTTSPAYLLDVSGSTRVAGNLIGDLLISAATEYRLNNLSYSRVAILDAAGAFAGGYNFKLSGTTPQHDSLGAIAGYYYQTAGSISFYTGGSQAANTNATARLVIDSNGSVGIGSTTPGAKLDVIGNVRAQSFTGSFSGSITAPGSNTQVIYNSSGVLAGSNSFVFNGGNVGIGTTSPVAYIDAALAVRAIEISGAGRSGIRLTDSTSVNQVLDIGVNGSKAYIGAVYSTTPTIEYNAFSTHAFITNAIERMRITSGGSVGIGTTSPAYKLDVSGTLGVTGASTFTSNLLLQAPAGIGTYIRFTNDSTSIFDIGHLNGAGAGAYVYQRANQPLIFGTNNATALTIASTGAATFSSTVAATTYYVTPSGSSLVYNIVNSDNTYTGAYVFQAGGGSAGYGGSIVAYGHSHASKAGWVTAGISNLSGGKFSVNTQALGGGTDVFVVQANGNVGIGSTSPAYKLDVSGTLGVTGASTFGGNINVNSLIDFKLSSSTYYQLLLQSPTANFKIYNSNYGRTDLEFTQTTGAATFSSSVTAVSFIETSTKKKKDNIKSYSTDINKFKQLEPVSYTWKDTGKSDVGLIAEEVDQLFPEFVSKTDGGEVTGINYGKLTTILINIVKQQQERIEKLEKQINK